MWNFLWCYSYNGMHERRLSICHDEAQYVTPNMPQKTFLRAILQPLERRLANQTATPSNNTRVDLIDLRACGSKYKNLHWHPNLWNCSSTLWDLTWALSQVKNLLVLKITLTHWIQMTLQLRVRWREHAINWANWPWPGYCELAIMSEGQDKRRDTTNAQTSWSVIWLIWRLEGGFSIIPINKQMWNVRA